MTGAFLAAAPKAGFKSCATFTGCGISGIFDRKFAEESRLLRFAEVSLRLVRTGEDDIARSVFLLESGPRSFSAAILLASEDNMVRYLSAASDL